MFPHSIPFTCIIVLNLLNFFCDGVRLIREKGFRDNTYFYHLGNNGHTYHYNQETASSIYFKCTQYERLQCRGRAILRLNGGFRETQHHNHAPDPDFVAARHFRENVLENVMDDNYVSFQDIIDHARRDRRYTRRVRSQMNLRRLRTAMYRKRMQSFPPIPQSLTDLTRVLLEHPGISMTVDKEENMYAGSVTAIDGSHHVAFVSPRMLQFLGQVKTLHGDGTFRARPATPASSQVFVLVIPIAWVLMERRTRPAYRAVFNLLKQICPNLQPDIIISDWEYPQQREWQEAFPNAEIQGCLWHLCRAFIIKARKLGVMRYRKDFPEILNFIRKACAIALLPTELFEEALDILRNQARNIDLVAAYLLWPFFNYIQTKWIGSDFRRNWMTLYKTMHRTNNACETHNRMLRKVVGAYRPNIYFFLKALASLEHNAHLDVIHMREGGTVRRTRRWQSVYRDRQLRALANDLEMDIFQDREDTIWNFISRASHLFQGAFDNLVEQR